METTMGTLSVITIVIVEVIKRTQFVKDPSRWMPLLSMVIGGVLGYAYGFDLISMVMIGGSASGVYDLVKKTVRNK